MKKKLLSMLLVGSLLLVGSATAFASSFMNGNDPTVIKEDTSVCEEFDVTDKELDSYLNSIDDPTKKDLLEKYFYLPAMSVSKEEITLKSRNTSLVDQAKTMSKLSNAELKEIVDQIEANIPKLLKKQEKSYNDCLKELEKAVQDSLSTAGEYKFPLYGAMKSTSGQDVVWIKSEVTWGVNSSNQVTYLVPSTTTGKTSYYDWGGSIGGNEYISSGKGYVNKYRSFHISGMETPSWEVYCSGKFGQSSIPEQNSGGYR